jgi:ABC-type multidrug transport system fused ATPase/permease subunit
VDFIIKAGTTTAIVGPSGAGKSTIIQMVERFYDPAGGNILFGDTNIKSIPLKTLRERIGYVSQEPVLVIGTVRENLKYGNVDASEEDIKLALSKANATFVYEMEKGLDSFVGSTTVLNLSGGQKQRIAIARALVKNPTILILDEATSALDPKSEKEVQGAIDQIAAKDKDLTIITIAHRLSTIMSSQHLLYIKSRDNVVGATKGTKEYDDIIKIL